MNDKLKNGIALSLIPQIVLVKILASFPEFIEKYYSQGFYPLVSRLFRTLLGWIPFSVGDLIYALLIILAIRYLYRNWRQIGKKPKVFVRDVFMVLSIVYLTFHINWGFNYYRLPLSKSLELTEKHDFKQLVDFTETLIQASNQIHVKINSDSTRKIDIPYSQKEIFKKTIAGFDALQEQWPTLAYDSPCAKTSLFSTMLSYMGYGGYLNPFTNEAQVNGRLPNFRFPVVAGHEIGHQIGYAAENETNFIGYLVTLNNDDVYFQYTALTYALGYCLSDIRRKDKKQFEELYGKVNKGIQLEFQAMNEFWKAFENPLEPVFKSIFNTYLKANNQEDGLKSYSRVVTLLVTYHQDHPL
ncbi:DUF3810 domain-containing protein [Poritiphilus flavus]|uniref:DUF3810 family protein n=1 Tax=Poritiphilus flavus TaxID=2697053 RepID=A0A6L9E9Z7_9FLAO|nr:DUF3810 domain-containing protein [Poritiphilus flavus]NAS11382.1 DUF3810 family protein [Poritiphilus flavus]